MVARKLRVGINGFGRIGRAIFRINHKKQLFDIVAVNDINPDIKNMAYLLQYDTTYGRFDEQVNHSEDNLMVGSNVVKVYKNESIGDVPWDAHKVDLVVDSSGIKKNLDEMSEDDNNSSVKNFIVTNAPTNYKNIKTIIFGVNEHECDTNKYRIFSSSICDTIALSPLIKMITNTHNIESGYLITLHPWLSYQNLLDGPSVSWSQPGDVFSHYALGRASTQNIIPKSTSAVEAANMVIPNLSEKLQSFSYRVPTQIVSGAVLILLLDKEITRSEIIERFHGYEAGQKNNVIHNTMEPLTSLDYKSDEHSVIIDHRWTKVEKGKHLKLVYWYDNEWGYSNRVVDLVCQIAGT